MNNNVKIRKVINLIVSLFILVVNMFFITRNYLKMNFSFLF